LGLVLFVAGCNKDSGVDPKNPEIVCDDGIDDNGDGLVDCADPTCAADPACGTGTTTTGGTTGGTTGLGDLAITLDPADCCTIQHQIGITECPQYVGTLTFTNSTGADVAHSASCTPASLGSAISFRRDTGGNPVPMDQVNAQLSDGGEVYEMLFNCNETATFLVDCVAQIDDGSGAPVDLQFSVQAQLQ